MANNQDWVDYGYVGSTPISTIRELKPITVKGLYYIDDDGNKRTPSRVWFSCDSRNWHQNESLVHGRACTSYFGKNGTCLTPVYLPDGTRYRVDLCDVTAYYKDGVLYDFYRE